MERQGSVIRQIDKLSNAIDRAVGMASALLFGAMTIAVLTGVFYRHVLNMPLSWPEEVSRYLMIWGACLAITLGIKADEHVGLTIIMDRLKSRAARLALRSLICLVVLVFQAIMFIYAVRMVQDARFIQTMALGITMTLPYLAIPTAMAFSIVQLILVFILKAAHDDEGPSAEPKIIDI